MVATSNFKPISLGALARFGLLALVPVVALGLVLAQELNVDVQQRYLDSTRTSATLITQVGVQPLLTQSQVTGGLSEAEVTQVDARLQGAAVGQEVTRIKVWNRAGTIVYSDNHALIGRTFSIDDDLAEAERWNDTERASRARSERDFLLAELASATGIHRRPRRLASESERARVNVTRAIRSAIGKIRTHDPDAAAHLDQAVRTGTYCSYTAQR